MVMEELMGPRGAWPPTPQVFYIFLVYMWILKDFFFKKIIIKKKETQVHIFLHLQRFHNIAHQDLLKVIFDPFKNKEKNTTFGAHKLY